MTSFDCETYQGLEYAPDDITLGELNAAFVTSDQIRALSLYCDMGMAPSEVERGMFEEWFAPLDGFGGNRVLSANYRDMAVLALGARFRELNMPFDGDDLLALAAELPLTLETWQGAQYVNFDLDQAAERLTALRESKKR